MELNSKTGRLSKRKFLERIQKFKKLKKEEELELCKKAHKDNSARKKLIESNLWLCAKIAENNCDQGLDYLDLIQEGTIGLMKAIERFKWQKGFRFTTYAGWPISQIMKKAIAESGKIVRVPVNSGKEVEVFYINDLLDVPSNKSIEAAEKAYDIGKLIDRIKNLISKFNGRDQEIFLRRLGWDGTFQLRSLEEIGIQFGITRERVRQIVAKSLALLRRKGIQENENTLFEMFEFYHQFKENYSEKEELMRHKIAIKMGPHRHPNRVPDGAQRLFEELFSYCDFTENHKFKVLLGEIIPRSGMTKRIEVRKIDGHGRSVVVVCRTGDNGTRHNYYVFRPSGYKGTLTSFFYTLQEGEKKMNGKEEEDLRPTKATEEIMKEKKPEIQTEKAQKPSEFPAHTTRRGKRPDAKKVLGDEVMLKAVLHEISEEENVLQKELKNRIEALRLECSSDGAICFLEREGCIKRDRKNKIISFFSLSKKGKELLGLKEADVSHAETILTTEPAPATAGPAEKPVAVIEEKTIEPIEALTDLEILSRELSKVQDELSGKKEMLAAAEKAFIKAKKAFEAEQAEFQEITKRKEEIKEKMRKLLDMQ